MDSDTQALLDSVSKLWQGGNFDSAISLCLEPAQSNISCQLVLGWMYFSDKNPNRDLERAIYWFRQAADNNHPDAMFGLGSVYYAEEQYKDALDLFLSASKRGVVRASFWTGYMYEKGLGTNKDTNKALVHYIHGKAHGDLASTAAYIKIMQTKAKGILDKLKLIPIRISLAISIIRESKNDPESESITDIKKYVST